MRQVQCSTCSHAISLDDTIVSSGGHLSHLDCRSPQTLTPDERALLFSYCSAHAVAECAACHQSFRHEQLGADLFSHRTNLCPRCRVDLTLTIRRHLNSCSMLPIEIRSKAQALREAARHLVKESQQLREASAVLIVEAEAALKRRLDALREALNKTLPP